MEIAKITMPVEKAREEWKAYNAVLKDRRDSYALEMKTCLNHLKNGKQLIDIFGVLKAAGVNNKGQPNLAIARADWTKCHFRKIDTGRGHFAPIRDNWSAKGRGDVNMPPETFIDWPRRKDGEGKDTWQTANEFLAATIPVIPAVIMPEGELKNYYILWQPKTWEELPETKDPLLLKRITENMFVILAAWDVTELEQAILNRAQSIN